MSTITSGLTVKTDCGPLVHSQKAECVPSVDTITYESKPVSETGPQFVPRRKGFLILVKHKVQLTLEIVCTEVLF